MNKGKWLGKVLFVVLGTALGYAFYYAWYSFPLISGYDAKVTCSCVFNGGRNLKDIKKEELNMFPLSLGSVDVNTNDSSVTASVWGMAKRRAVYRRGFGCTLVNGLSENELRAQGLKRNISSSIGQDSIPWPRGDRISDTLPMGLDQKQLNAAVQDAFAGRDSASHTRALLVVYKGQLVAEQYARGFDKNSVMIGWSMAKSITSALIGILVKEGKLQEDAAAPVPEWSDTSDPRHRIKLKDLLQQTSGLGFEENYAKYSDVTQMLFNEGNMAAFTATVPAREAPGERFYYSSGNSNLLSRIIRTRVGEAEYYDFPYRSLFNKLGMHSALFEPDASGTFVGSSYIFATARDYARFGLLYYYDGLWNEERILPDGWVKKSTMPPPGNVLKNYGYQFWLNGYSKKDPRQRAFPAVPSDMYYADGFGGQGIYIIPSKSLVVVRLGLSEMDDNALLGKICRSVN